MSKRNSYISGPVKYCFIAAFAVISLTACVSEQDEALFRQSMMMAQQGNKEAAYKNVKELCSKFPQDKRFCAEEEALEDEIYNENMTFVRAKLGQPVVSMSDLSASEERLNKAALYSDGNPEVSKYKTLFTEQQKKTTEAIESAKVVAAQSAENGDYFSAYEAAVGAKALDPAVFGPMADEYGAKAISVNMPEAEKMLAEDNLKEAKELLAKMMKIDPENAQLKQYIALAEKNDTAEYYMTKGDEASEAGDLPRALTYYKKALAFPDVRQQAQRAIDNTRVQIIEVSFMQGVDHASQDLNKQAYDNFIYAFSTMKDIPLEMRTMVSIPKEDLEGYYDNLFYLGQKAHDEGSFGQAYLYFTMLYDLSPSYLGLREIKQSTEDKILARSLKSIAVIPFKSPVSEPELGLQVTSNIMQILQKALDKDVKIIERGALEILLREYELAVAGSVNEQSTGTDSFKIKSADYLLMGEVLDSRTETNIQNSKKKVRVKVSENKIRNIEWEDWNKDAEELKAKNRPVEVPEPPKYIMQPVYDYAEYDTAFHEKVSYLSISYRVVETSQGRITYSNTVRAQKEARDEATSGIDLGSYKVDMKAANLPTDIELSNDVRTETIDKISSQVKELFKDQDEKYLGEAERLESSNNLKEAVEMYVNAILLKDKKGKDVTELKDKAGKYLDVLSIY
jgi:tetratricopeptide (TPR) repeat protein